MSLEKDELITCRTCGSAVVIVPKGIIVTQGYTLCAKCSGNDVPIMFNYLVTGDGVRSLREGLKALRYEGQDPKPLPIEGEPERSIWERLRTEEW